MRKITKPEWLLFGERCRDEAANFTVRKSMKREQFTIDRWYLEAREKYGYEGTIDDWCYLLRWRRVRT